MNKKTTKPAIKKGRMQQERQEPDHRLALVTPNLSSSASSFPQLVQEVPSRAGMSNSITDGAGTQSSFTLQGEHFKNRLRLTLS